MGRTARVLPRGLTAVFQAAKYGIQALYNPYWDRHLAETRDAVIIRQPFSESGGQDIFGLFLHVFEIILKDFSSRMNFRKAILCPDYDHLHMVEAKGGLTTDKTDFWDSVAACLDELAQLSAQEAEQFSPEVVEISDAQPSFSDLASGSNCFIDNVVEHTLFSH
jgi:hypothetical protein